MHQNVCLRQKGFKEVSLIGFVEIDASAMLAQRHLGDDANLIPSGRIDAKHIRSVAGEKRCSHRQALNQEIHGYSFAAK
jgi:hypothetical protein